MVGVGHCFFVFVGCVNAVSDQQKPEDSAQPEAAKAKEEAVVEEESDLKEAEPESEEGELDPEPEPAPDYFEFANEVREQWLAGYGLGPDDEFSDIDFGEEDTSLISEIVEIVAPAENHI